MTTYLRPGEPAPGFDLEGVAPEMTRFRVTLKDLTGSSLVLFFYPKDATSG